MRNIEIEKAIEATIDYAGKYKCVLSQEELIRRLITSRKFPKSEIIKATLKYQNKLGRKNKSRWYDKKLEKAEKYGKLFSKILPNIIFMAVTGSVASRYPKKNDDIDYLVVTKKNHLWITRLMLRMLVFLARIPHRKYDQKENKDELCFNLWLDEDALLIPEKKQNLKNAIDSRLMIPIVDKKNILDKFLWENKWISKYLGLGKDVNNKIPKAKTEKENKLTACLNFLCYWPQYWVMKPKMKQEKVNLKQAFFHPEGE